MKRRKPVTVHRRRESAAVDGEVRRVNATAHGRVLEAKGTAEDGTRIWRAVVIEAGESLNGRLYEAATLEKATPLYGAAKVYNRHRTDADLQTSTTEGLVGYLRNPEFTGHAIEADLHLFASATSLAEALDASVETVAAGLAPLVGLSHDVLATGVPVTVEGRQVDQIRTIEQVLSVDVVADPASGGRALRVVAGGIDPDTQPNPATSEEDITMERLKELMAKHLGGTITDEERGELATLLADELGVDLEAITIPAEEATEAATTDTAEPVAAGAVSESRRFEASSFEGQAIIRTALDGVPARMREAAEKLIPAKFTEADLRNILAPTQAIAAELEKQGLLEEGPSVPHVQVVKESRDKLVERLDATLAGGHSSGKFRSFREMWLAFNPDTPQSVVESADLPHMLLREAYRGSARLGEARVTEAIDTTTFGEILGDSIRRRMIAEYGMPQLANWREIVSEIGTLTDFRTNRRQRMGGYGTLPAVNQGANYNALTSPTDEEATFAASKRGGTEDLTMESIANDDLGALRAIPQKLGRSAAVTLHRFVWNFVVTNPTIYDTVALYHASHANLGAAALTDATLATARTAMRKQAAYNNSTEVLGATPKYLIVPPELEQIAFELSSSQPKVIANANATIPNIHQGINAIVLDWLTDTNNWYLVADPAMIPTIEIGFFRGQEEPELFVQDMGDVGSMFTADKLTYKIRHIYGGAVLDYRGFYGAVVA